MDGLFIINMLAIANRSDEQEGNDIVNQLNDYFGLELVSTAINTMQNIKSIKLVEEK